MDLGKLFPTSSKKKSRDKLVTIMYLCMVEWGWSYEQFLNTPVHVIHELMKYHNKVVKKRNKK